MCGNLVFYVWFLKKSSNAIVVRPSLNGFKIYCADGQIIMSRIAARRRHSCRSSAQLAAFLFLINLTTHLCPLSLLLSPNLLICQNLLSLVSYFKVASKNLVFFLLCTFPCRSPPLPPPLNNRGLQPPRRIEPRQHRPPTALHCTPKCKRIVAACVYSWRPEY